MKNYDTCHMKLCYQFVFLFSVQYIANYFLLDYMVYYSANYYFLMFYDLKTESTWRVPKSQ